MTAKSDELVEELVSACVAFGREKRGTVTHWMPLPEPPEVQE